MPDAISDPLMRDVTELARAFGRVREALDNDDPDALYRAVKEVNLQSGNALWRMKQTLLTRVDKRRLD